ncbi:hypothetical protein SAMD00019534_055190 [Acytostelium subglobosum LB1]|uniref:hypothetical protein n=1 Tax=Acytostelium subglobosum LB1 TaxID=1410327 RepID=UPI000644D45E|nr:hypothetical protein SAMD00019534_055190 [Acytostelium subglobosum LB1]GAM22344.1 hypothetical protein SAMD00019534_055190 [Acytostelium subglobosum LB1]|eukprot:XP_012754464.1 hypothetical protein SAMD00019534_055190 [Acytostelium subglobosum LB1]
MNGAAQTAAANTDHHHSPQSLGSGASGGGVGSLGQVSQSSPTSTTMSLSDSSTLSIGSGSGNHPGIQFASHGAASNSNCDSSSSSGHGSAPVFNGVCFHPTAPVVYVSVRNEIYIYDLLTQSNTGKISVDPKEVIRNLIILNNNGTGSLVLASTSSKILVGLCDAGLIYLWDTDTHKLLTIVHPLKQLDSRIITCRANSVNRAIIFFSKTNSKDIVAVDCQNKSPIPYKLKGHKRPLSSLAHHPTKFILASVSVDGSLKIWETRSQMASLHLEDFVSYENTRNIEHSTNFFLMFEATAGKYMVMTGSSGLTIVYGDISTSSTPEILANGFICKGHNILSLVHHPHLPVFFVLSVNPQGVEELSAWEVNTQSKSVVPSMRMSSFSPTVNNDTLNYLSKYAKPLTLPRLTPTNVIFHPTRNYFTFQWDLFYHASASLNGVRHINQFIYSINSFESLQSTFPLLSSTSMPLGFFFTPDHTFNYPADLTYFDGTFVKSYQPLNGVSKKLVPSPLIPVAQDEQCKPKSFTFNPDLQLMTLIYDSYSMATQTMLSKYLICDVAGMISQQGDGIDAVMLGTSPTQILILGLDGKLAKIASATAQGISSFKSHPLAPRVTSVYKTPLNDSRVVMYYSHDTSAIYFSKNINQGAADNYIVDQSSALHLNRAETVLRVEWQTDPKTNTSVCAIMTDQRIIITNAKLSVITQISVPPGHRAESRYFGSIYWLEWTLLYTTPTHLMYLTMQHNLPPRPILSLSISPIYLASVLPDRMLYGYAGVTVPGRTETTIHCQSVGLLEPLVAGLLALPASLCPDKRTIGLYLQNLVSHFDHTRASRFILDRLRERGFTDLAYSLAHQMRTCQSKLSPLEKFRLAWQSKQYVDAYRYLAEENKAARGAQASQDPAERRQLSKLNEYIRDFGRECMNAGYYQLARECFAILGEHIYLLQISILLNDRDAVTQLRKDSELANDAVMVAACDRFLNKKTPAPDTSKVNPPVIKILPWQPTADINVGIKIGNDYLSTMNLYSIQRYYPITLSFSNTMSSNGTARHKLRAPDEKWPPEDYKHSVVLSPPRTLMSLVANKLSTKTHISSTQTLRRSPSAENITKQAAHGGAASDAEDYDSDDESGADVDSDIEDLQKQVTKNIEDQMKALAEANNDADSVITEGDDELSASSSTPHTNPLTPLSSTPVQSMLTQTP